MPIRDQPARPSPRKARLAVRWARCAEDIASTQRLRHDVFVDELGARAATQGTGLERDWLDPWCDHLLVRDAARDLVVAACRVLPGERARKLGTFYADTEFDLTRLALRRDQIVEVGRSCVHPDYRDGPATLLLWETLARYVEASRCRYVIASTSVSMRDPCADAHAIWRRVRRSSLAPVELRVWPRLPMIEPDVVVGAPSAAALPPLLRACLRLGAWVGGEPAWDPDFGTADFLTILVRERLAERFAPAVRRAA